MGPLYKYGWFDFAGGLQIALLIGFCFGFLLERAGFGNPKKLTAIFFLKDFAVLKVMFTAIVVCALGLLYFSVFGWIDLGRIYMLPTYLWPQMVGGFILGVGFIMGGYCPTTSVVATVSGKLDGLIFIFGMMGGSILFAEVFPLLEGFYNAGSMGPVRLSEVLSIPSGIMALMISLMAVSVYWLVEKVENRFGDPETLPKGSPRLKRLGALALILLGLILAVVNPDRFWDKKPLSSPKGEDIIEAPSAQPAPHPAFQIKKDEGC